jgi:hypothetical protein
MVVPSHNTAKEKQFHFYSYYSKIIGNDGSVTNKQNFFLQCFIFLVWFFILWMMSFLIPCVLVHTYRKFVLSNGGLSFSSSSFLLLLFFSSCFTDHRHHHRVMVVQRLEQFQLHIVVSWHHQ